MAAKLPRVIGLKELLSLRKPLRERPAPVAYFSDREFARLIEGATELRRRPGAAPLAAFEPWSGGGMVQGRCESPEGQICYGQWTPGPAGGGVYLRCQCRPIDGGPVPPQPRKPCELMISQQGRFQCAGECRFGRTCGLAFYRHPEGSVMLGCRCVFG
jgi:hypothetical protein